MIKKRSCMLLALVPQKPKRSTKKKGNEKKGQRQMKNVGTTKERQQKKLGIKLPKLQRSALNDVTLHLGNFLKLDVPPHPNPNHS